MEPNNAASDLAHIRTLMDRSTRFISLSGLSGVFAGAVALGGAWVAQYHVAEHAVSPGDRLTYGTLRQGLLDTDGLLITLMVDALIVLVLALVGAAWFTWRRSKRLGHGLWDRTALRLMWNLLIPLAAGGLVCLALMYHGLPGLVAPATLVFYGLALLNASKYTLDEIRWLALSELVLGVWWPPSGSAPA